MRKKEKGFTILEILVALAVAGLMLGIVTSQLRDWFSINVKSATRKLSSTIRYLHDKASTQNLYIRLVFDFEKNSYWVEATTERFLLTSKEILEDEREEIKKEKEEEKKEVKEAPAATETAEAGEGETETEEITYVKKYRTPEFGAVDEFLLKPVRLPEGVLIKDIYTSHDEGPVEGGKAFIHFFPNGYIEPAIINLMDEDDEVHISIEINPIVGDTYVREEYRSWEKEK